MSPELQGVVIGGLIGSISSLIGILVNHWLAVRRDKYRLKLETEREFRRKLTEGLPPSIYSRGMERLYTMIDEGKLPRTYALDPKFIDAFLDDLLAEEKAKDKGVTKTG